ncbi:hypothetical protein PNP59_13540 [Halobacterium salinarum]|uniref:Restriction endonuclease n=1 Tax=Halobacterium salinarum (strain ATCC 33171 / DSM 3754 / JCM 8978 / NBRC 102687 / NCIMB 764 / 91-R6) TaxID=2597657 RepID=A0A4D6GZ58_HALS9|nr:hypothetical protein [Halobacterium salinarum]MDL0131934.1 hypothetical protein [Halobacterium salinarum]MDL0134777.1 hypothetical protein [Halobacterium salinarum]MDL0144717.1 hypothetical protein [Halobacterium salinarum]QCC46138.1 uncharacterized protein HBSAL_13120 [Halobacterium salinarum]TYO71839.1 hypothetical protein APQ99_02387 [Halobacterium salinarum DSM 3754]
MTGNDSPLSAGYADHLRSLTETIEALRGTLEADHTLSTDQRLFAQRLLYLANEPISEAVRLLPEPDHDDAAADDQAVDSPVEYAAAVTRIEQQLSWLIRSLRAGEPAAHHYDEAPTEKFTTALEYATALRDILPEVPDDSPVLTDLEGVSVDEADPHVGGRGDSDGRWLEYQLQRALERWGYGARRRQHLFSLEVDVVARRRDKRQEPSDWIVGQCKDWTDDPITPAALFRLCTVAFACRAMPVLCHTTELTPRTEKLAREFEVRVLTLKDLECAELPAPQVARPIVELGEWQPQYRARDDRGSFPLLFRSEPGKRFSYVPGFTPVGKDADYEPIEDDTDDDTHPAADH